MRHATRHVCAAFTRLQVVTDLLDPTNTSLKIHEQRDQVYVGGLTEKIVVSPEEMMQYMREGLCCRVPWGVHLSGVHLSNLSARPNQPPHWQHQDERALQPLPHHLPHNDRESRGRLL